MSKSFQVPAAVLVPAWPTTDPNARAEMMSFLQFAETVWVDDTQACLDAQGKPSQAKMRRWFGVIGKIEKAEPGDWITLEDEDYATLRKIVESPQRIFPSLRKMRSGLPFVDAVLKAVDQIPAALTAAANG